MKDTVTTSIHSTAIIHPDADIAEDVIVGAYTVIDQYVKIGKGTTVGPHCHITGRTTLGRNNKIYTSAVIGTDPQDLKYSGVVSYLRIGDNNVFREHITINPGTNEGSETVIGNNNTFLTMAHVAHDCHIGDHNVIVNQVALAGHVQIGDHSIIGGLTGVHQFVRIGSYAMVGAESKIIKDVLPYALVDGYPARTHGVNTIGLLRKGFDEEKIKMIKEAYRTLFYSKISWEKAQSSLRSKSKNAAEVENICKFIEGSKRGITPR